MPALPFSRWVWSIPQPVRPVSSPALYVVFVPFFNMFLRQERTSQGSWIGAFLAVAGMFLLSVTEQMHMAWGDFLVLLCAACFAGHLLVVGRYSSRVPVLPLCLAQYLVCAILSLMTAAFFEPIEMASVRAAAIPLLYGGIMSVGVAYSLQVVGQQKSPASHAAVILSLESVFAAVGGWLILGEVLTGRGKNRLRSDPDRDCSSPSFTGADFYDAFAGYTWGLIGAGRSILYLNKLVMFMSCLGQVGAVKKGYTH